MAGTLSTKYALVWLIALAIVGLELLVQIRGVGILE